jgi:lysophospholipase L1-like esterase
VNAHRGDRAERKLVVVGDSLTFYLETDTDDPPLDHPRSLPLRIAAHLAELTGERWSAVNLGEGGRAVFDAYNVLRRDEFARSTIADADAVFFAVCTKDGALHPIPRPARAVIGLIPKPHRGKLVHWLKPKLARITSRQFRMTRTSLFSRRWRGCIDIIRELNPRAPLLCATPAREYGPQTWLTFPDDWESPGGFVSEVHALIDSSGLPKVDFIALMDEHFPPVGEGWDYLHWPAEMHDAAGRHVAELLVPLLEGEQRRVLAIAG